MEDYVFPAFFPYRPASPVRAATDDAKRLHVSSRAREKSGYETLGGGKFKKKKGDNK